MRIAMADTETTGLPIYGPGVQSDDPRQPHLVELGVHVFDDQDPSGAEIAGYDTLIRPDGWSIDERLVGDDGKPTAFASHGITQERAMDEGIPLREALDWFFGDVLGAVTEHGFYNSGFDTKILRGACVRTYGRTDFPHAHLLTQPRFCVQRSVSPFTKLPPTEKMIRAGLTWSKTPKLVEAYAWATEAPFPGRAHGALSDSRAGAAVYRAIVERHGREAIVHVPIKDHRR